MTAPLLLRPTLLAPAAVASKRGAQAQEAKRARALRTWFAALADRENNPANIVIVGDSMTEGQATSIVWGQRYVDRLRAGIRARYPVSGVTGGVGYISTTNGLLDSSVFPVVHVGTVNTNSQSGPKKRSRNFNGSGMTTTWTVTGTAIDLMYWRGTGTGTISYSIDGGAATNVDTSGSAASGTLLRISLGSAGVHTVTVAWVSGSFNYVEGIIVYNGDETKGVRLHECGRSGISAYQWDQVNHELTSSWSRAVGVALDPDLLIIALGINDYAQLVTKAAYKSAIQSMIADIRSNTTVDPSIMLVSFPTSSAAGLAPFSQYADAMEEIANEDPEICTAHLGATYGRMPNVSGDTLGLYSDTTHFSVKGHAMFADLLLPIIAPAQGITSGGAGTVTEVTGTSPISVATGTSTPVVSVAAASDTAAGVVEYATNAETLALSATNRAITPANLGAYAAFVQPLDSDLTAIALLSTTSFGRALLTAANAAALRTAAELDAAGILTQLLTVDGAGSGLDADLLDGLTSLQILRGAPMVSGSVYDGINATAGTSVALVQDIEMCIPFRVARACTIDQLSCRHGANGAAGSVYRLGLRADNAGVPSSTVLGEGTVTADAGASSTKNLTVSIPVTPGRYWRSITMQIGTGATVACSTQSFEDVGQTSLAVTFGYYSQSGVTGALPAWSGSLTASGINTIPRIGVRAA